MISDFSERIQDIIKKIDEMEKELSCKENENKLNTVSNVFYSRKDVELIYKKYFNELDKLVGLNEVKLEIKKLIDYLIFIKKMGKKINLDRINLNMVFRGNPGTGKTTVAKIIAKLLYQLGFVSSDKVVETTPRDFIAGYVGQTAIKANSTIEQARGGVIFIDEAYTFAQSFGEEGHSFVQEAITEIIKEMETNNTVFIFSGYSKEMHDFIELNPGIKSRIAYDINFKNYTKEELYTIFSNKVTNSGLKLSEDAKDILLEKIESKMKIKNFGNGRMIDNLFNEILREHASINLYEVDENKLLMITKSTVENIKIKFEGGMCFE